jgi:IS5 family transposase
MWKDLTLAPSRGHWEEETTVYVSDQKRGVNTRSLRKWLKHRQAIEPIIGHLKSDGRLNRNYLLGEQGDAINALLCCAGHNLRLVLRKFRLFWPSTWSICRAHWGSWGRRTKETTLWLPAAINRLAPC